MNTQDVLNLASQQRHVVMLIKTLSTEIRMQTVSSSSNIDRKPQQVTEVSRTFMICLSIEQKSKHRVYAFPHNRVIDWCFVWCFICISIPISIPAWLTRYLLRSSGQQVKFVGMEPGWMESKHLCDTSPNRFQLNKKPPGWPDSYENWFYETFLRESDFRPPSGDDRRNFNKLLRILCDQINF